MDVVLRELTAWDRIGKYSPAIMFNEMRSTHAFYTCVTIACHRNALVTVSVAIGLVRMKPNVPEIAQNQHNFDRMIYFCDVEARTAHFSMEVCCTYRTKVLKQWQSRTPMVIWTVRLSIRPPGTIANYARDLLRITRSRIIPHLLCSCTK